MRGAIYFQTLDSGLTGVGAIAKSWFPTMVQEVEDFYGVYLLLCLNPKFKGRTYIGYTVNPNRRIKQHNTGAHAGGAYRTSGRGPWEMVLIIHGFPNDVCGLRFEWAWQHPDKSRRLRAVTGKSKKETAFQYRWRVVCNMLRTAPWCGLGLNIRWLKQEYQLDFPDDLEPPLHMPVVYGPVVSKKVTKSQKGTSRVTPSQDPLDEGVSLTKLNSSFCAVCRLIIKAEDTALSCLRPSCLMKAHIICLAKHFLGEESKLLLPVEGKCPYCGVTLLWGELVRQRKGCHKNLSESALQIDKDRGDQVSN
ncbi:structure-specific endonuclease subunit SLX1 homolog [Elysia marginata]|uniref:Structure-specific endonuclease subunit SLX1 homolog n=1 Tax=Elysia marginata TaxID=1093978 RepID=A0AAV4G154_9GAST|nr:structure-specific endonuclease subunit SLX1 homolog [Elysia marginata]